jgi:hypothetical protein
MKAFGKMTNNMEKEQKFGKKVVNMKVNTIWEENRVMENIHGLMGHGMKGTGSTTELVDMEYIIGKMEEDIMANG